MNLSRSAHVIVAGDLSCSPRILSQAKFLTKEGWKVSISAYNVNSVLTEDNSCKILSIPSYSLDFGQLFVLKFLNFFLKVCLNILIKEKTSFCLTCLF